MLCRTRISTLLALVLATHTAAAHPHADTDPHPAATPVEETSYRSHTLTVDAIGLGLFIAGAASEGPDGEDTTASGALMGAGLIGSVLASPIVHAVHGRGWRALGSFGMRYGLASVGALVSMGLASSTCDELFCEMQYLGAGVVSGLVVASALDAALFTSERRERPPTWAPTVSAHRDGARVGFVATF